MRADEPGEEARDGVRIVRSLPLWSERLGLVGRADVVEFRPGPDGRETPYPVDTKRGKRRPWENDDIQLCAQALCLEEMLGVEVPRGAIFHAGSRRRREVVFDAALRAGTVAAIEGLRALHASCRTPSAILHPRCDGCSVRDVCLPEATESARRAEASHARLFRVEEA